MPTCPTCASSTCSCKYSHSGTSEQFTGLIAFGHHIQNQRIIAVLSARRGTRSQDQLQRHEAASQRSQARILHHGCLLHMTSARICTTPDTTCRVIDGAWKSSKIQAKRPCKKQNRFAKTIRIQHGMLWRTCQCRRIYNRYFKKNRSQLLQELPDNTPQCHQAKYNNHPSQKYAIFVRKIYPECLIKISRSMQHCPNCICLSKT